MKRLIQIVCIAFAMLLTGTAPVAADEPDRARVTVSGISSGAYLATQVHVALSDRVDGVALLAGGPWRCAEGSIAHALGRCISGQALDVQAFIDAVRAAAQQGLIDDPAGLAGDRVWLFIGAADPVVNPALTRATAEFYRAFTADDGIRLVTGPDATHGWPTLSNGKPCGEMGDAYINACDFDAAGQLLTHLYGPLAPPAKANADRLEAMQQAGLVPDGAGFADTGFVYLPSSCSDRPEDCRLHIALHGCRQGAEFIGERFARETGLNAWAESNAIVVLYPQLNTSAYNPQGCWDWWGYTGAGYDLREAPQIRGIAALIDSWTSGHPQGVTRQ